MFIAFILGWARLAEWASHKETRAAKRTNKVLLYVYLAIAVFVIFAVYETITIGYRGLPHG